MSQKRPLDMTVNLSPEDIKVAILQYVWRELELSVGTADITINVAKEFNDRQPGDLGTSVLKGATVKVNRSK